MSIAALPRMLTVALVVVASWLIFAPARWGGHASYVITHGISMEPHFHAGDLAVIRPAGSYQVGDIVAYRSHVLDEVVMHRIVAVENGLYTFKGDHNTWLDPEQPNSGQIIGKLAFRVSHGGIWLKRATSPFMLTLLAFVLLAGETVHIRRSRKRRRKHAVARHTAQNPRPAMSMVAGSPQVRNATGTLATVAALGIALGALAWTAPLTKSKTSQAPAENQLTFSYAATVPRSPAYDGTTVTSPDPVFRTLASTVDVRFAYQGSPGKAAVTAELSAASGWHSTVPLAPPTRFTAARYDGSVRLDLTALDGQAQAAAAATGMPADQVALGVNVRVETVGGATFESTLELALTRQQLKLADPAKALTFKDPATLPHTILVPRTLTLAGRSMTAGTARALSAVLTLGTLLAGLLLLVVVRHDVPTTESDRICRRYAGLLVPVQPMPARSGRPTVDVAEFATLVKLAERYGLLVLHWTRSDVHTFVVQDEGMTYRYRTAATAPEKAAEKAAAPDPPSSDRAVTPG